MVVTRFLTGFGNDVVLAVAVCIARCVAAGAVDGARQIAGVHGVEEVKDPAHGEGDDCQVQLKLGWDSQPVRCDGIIV